jgi:signal peptidase I
MGKFGKALLWIGLVLAAVVGLARGVALRWWTVPEGDPYLEASIAPTLRGGDVVLLWRMTKPKFGDLVACPEPQAPERVVVGRIIGEPGDTVRVEGPKVYVNGRAAETEHACDPPKFTVKHPATGADVEQNCDVEAVAGVSHMRGSTVGHEVLPAPVNQKVEEGKFFLVSDNRLLPYDSRDFGLVDASTCTETVVFRVFSKLGFQDEKSRFVVIR